MMYKQDDIMVFRESVRLLCLYAAQVDKLTRDLESGQGIPMGMLAYTLSKVKSYRIFTLQAMNRMGIKDGIIFMEDNEYFGFSINNGRLCLEGDRGRVSEICYKWIRDFPEGSNWYQFGAAMYCICLAYVDEADLSQLYPEWLLESDDPTAGCETSCGMAA